MHCTARASRIPIVITHNNTLKNNCINNRTFKFNQLQNYN